MIVAVRVPGVGSLDAGGGEMGFILEVEWTDLILDGITEI